jgi:hypothetical protein
MKQFVDAVRSAISDQNYYAALALALTLPDIASKLEKPTEMGSARYKAWCEVYLEPGYIHPHFGPLGGKKFVWLSAADTYALRCALLHEGGDDISQQRAREMLDKFVFVQPTSSPGWHKSKVGNKLGLQVDVFCEDVCRGVEAWLAAVSGDADVQTRIGELIVIQDSATLTSL